MSVRAVIYMSSSDSVHMPPLTTTDVREFLESFGLDVGLVRVEIEPRVPTVTQTS